MTKSTQRTIYTLVLLGGGGYLLWVYWPVIKQWLSGLFPGGGQAPTNGDQASWLDQLLALLKDKADGDDTSSWLQALTDLLNQNGMSDDLEEILKGLIDESKKNGFDEESLKKILEGLIDEAKEEEEEKRSEAAESAMGTLTEILGPVAATGAATGVAGGGVAAASDAGKAIWAAAATAFVLWVGGVIPELPVLGSAAERVHEANIAITHAIGEETAHERGMVTYMTRKGPVIVDTSIKDEGVCYNLAGKRIACPPRADFIGVSVPSLEYIASTQEE